MGLENRIKPRQNFYKLVLFINVTHAASSRQDSMHKSSIGWDDHCWSQGGLAIANKFLLFNQPWRNKSVCWIEEWWPDSRRQANEMDTASQSHDQLIPSPSQLTHLHHNESPYPNGSLLIRYIYIIYVIVNISASQEQITRVHILLL